MDDFDKTMPPQREHVVSDTNDMTMPGKRDRKSDGRFEIGDLIMTRYKVLAELGQGGMGVVYKCFDETAGIEVALKALPPELSHNTIEMEDIKENFQLVAKLVHQNIAISKNLEKDNSNGNYYLIMECCEGEDLRRWIKRKRKEGELKLEDVLPIIKQVAEALDYAHKQKIIHRDIKPGNIMINNDGDIKVLDFGLAAQIHTSMTRVSMAYHGTSGTGPYMAPEQWRGRAQGAPADQYALAVMTYEMLAGHLPFESTDASVLREAVLNDTPEDIADISKNVQEAIKRAMSREPSERYETCSDFVAALGGKKIKAAKKQGKGFPKWAAVLLILILLAAGGTGYYFFDQHQKEQARLEQLAREKAQKIADTLTSAKNSKEKSNWTEVLKYCDEILKLDKAHQEALVLKVQTQDKIDEIEAAKKAREQKIATFLSSAEAANKKSDWQEVLRFCGEIQKLDAGNKKADALRAHAQKQIALEEQNKDKLQQENYRLQPQIKAKKSSIDLARYDRRQTFDKYLDRLSNDFAAAERAEINRDPVNANKFYKSAEKAANWIIENAPLRIEVQKLQSEIKDKKAKADQFTAQKLAYLTYRTADQQVNSAVKNYKNGNFKSAITELKSAITGYEKAFTESRKLTLNNLIDSAKLAQTNKQWDKVKEIAEKIRPLDDTKANEFVAFADKQIKLEKFNTALASARKAKAEKKWQKVYDYATAALNENSNDPESKKLKQLAESKLVPTLRIIAMIDEKRVPAKIRFGSKELNTKNILKGFKKNKRYSGKLSYSSGNAEYVEKLTFTCDWTGLKTKKITLQKLVVTNDFQLKEYMLNLCNKITRPDFWQKYAIAAVRKFDFKDFSRYDKNEDLLTNAICLGANLEVIKYIVEVKNADINRSHGYVKRNPLAAACENDRSDVVKYLIQKGADVNINKNERHCYPLSLVKSTAVTKLLLDAGADPTWKNSNGKTLPDVKSFDVALMLIERGASFTNGKDALLRKAAQAGSISFLKKHKEKLSQISDIMVWGARSGKKDVIEYLLSLGIPIDQKEEDGTTVLHAVASKGNVELLELIQTKMKMDVNVRDDRGNSPLSYAIYGNNIGITECLLKKGADPNITHKNGFKRPLLFASYNNQKKIVQLLLKHGAEVNYRDELNRSALSLAVQNNCIEVVKTLLPYKPVINYEHQYGSPLSDAVVRKYYKMTELLLKNGADPDFRRKNTGGGWQTALLYAVGSKDIDMVRLLLRHGADPNFADSQGRSPMSISTDPAIKSLLTESAKTLRNDTSTKLKKKHPKLEYVQSSDWLPRSVLLAHPEYARLNNRGHRVFAGDCCFSNGENIELAAKYCIDLLTKKKISRLFLRVSRNPDDFCKCSNCHKVGRYNGKFSMDHLLRYFCSKVSQKIEKVIPGGCLLPDTKSQSFTAASVSSNRKQPDFAEKTKKGNGVGIPVLKVCPLLAQCSVSIDFFLL